MFNREGRASLNFCYALLQVAIQEVRRLQKYGVTASEWERYTMALLRDSQQAAEQAASIPSAEMLDYTMESLGLDHVVMDQREVRVYHLFHCSYQLLVSMRLPSMASLEACSVEGERDAETGLLGCRRRTCWQSGQAVSQSMR